MRVKSTESQLRARKTIAAKARELRLDRKFTQHDLAARLHISQSRLSEIERGDGSFTAEQFLELLRLFNATPSDFVEPHHAPHLELQNALARLGAIYLQESAIVTSAGLEQVHAVVREALIDGSPRVITALAPVLVAHARSVNLLKAYAELHELGLHRRLAWVVENTAAALDTLANQTGSSARLWSKLKRGAEVPFRLFIEFASSNDELHGRRAAPDALDLTIRSMRTLADVQRTASPISRRWGIATSLQPDDFVHALRASRATD